MPSRGSVTCACSTPRSFAVSANGDIYIADTANSTVRHLTAAGRALAAVALQQPFSVAVTDNGDVFAYDLGTGDLTMFDQDLHLLRSLAFSSDADGRFTQSAHMATG